MSSFSLNLKHGTIQVNIPDHLKADPAVSNGGHPLNYVVKMKGSTTTYLNCLADLFSVLPKGLNVFEFCGGIGMIPLGTWEVFEPKKWVTVEIDKSCLEGYQDKRVEFILGDMYTTPIPSNTDLVLTDWPDNTLTKLWREPRRAAFMKTIADFRPRYWEITDVGYYWIHLANHWPLYQKKFGVQVTRDNYHVLFDQYMRDNYGYKVIRWEVGGGAQYFLMEPV